LPMSSASIRAIMAQLEKGCYLFQPHTSAGRIPTALGYRAYVDRLMDPPKLPEASKDIVSYAVDEGAAPVEQLRACAGALAQATGLTGFSLFAPTNNARHRQLELVRLSADRVLGIFVALSGTIRHRIVELDDAPTSIALTQIQNYLNARFEGQSYKVIETLIGETLEQTTTDSHTTLSHRAFSLAAELFSSPEKSSVNVTLEGQSHLLSYPEFSTARTVEPVLQEMERDSTWDALLHRVLGDVDVTVLIGPENSVQGFKQCAIAATSVPCDSGVCSVGIVGPTRLAYRSVIATVAFFGRYLAQRWNVQRNTA